MVNEYIMFAIGDICITNYGFYAALAVIAMTACFYLLNLRDDSFARRYVIPSLILPIIGAMCIIVRNIGGDVIGGIDFAVAQFIAIPLQVGIVAASAKFMHDSVIRAADGMIVAAVLGQAVFSLSNSSEIAIAETVVYFAIFAFLAVNFYLKHILKRYDNCNVLLMGIVLLGSMIFVLGRMNSYGIWVFGCVNLVRIVWGIAAVLSAVFAIVKCGSRFGIKIATIHGGICFAMWAIAIFSEVFVAEYCSIIMCVCLLIMCVNMYCCCLSGKPAKSLSAKKSARNVASGKNTKANTNRSDSRESLQQARRFNRNVSSARVQSKERFRQNGSDDYSELLSMYSERENRSSRMNNNKHDRFEH